MSTVADVLAASVLVAILGTLVVAAIMVARGNASGMLRPPVDRPPASSGRGTAGADVVERQSSGALSHHWPSPTGRGPEANGDRLRVEQDQSLRADPSLPRAMDNDGGYGALPAPTRDNDLELSGSVERTGPAEPLFLFTDLPDALTDVLCRAGDAVPLSPALDDVGTAEPQSGGRPSADSVDAPSRGNPFLFNPSPPAGDVESPAATALTSVLHPHEPLPPADHDPNGDRSAFRASLLESIDPISGVPPHVGDNVGICAGCGAVYSSRSVESIASRVGRCVVCSADWAQAHPRMGIIDAAGRLLEDQLPDRTRSARHRDNIRSTQNGSGPTRPRTARSSRSRSRAHGRINYEIGDLVEHDFYGLGEVSQVETRAGMEAIIWVSFDGDPDDVPIIERYQGMRHRI